MLSFNGSGSAFNTKLGNTSAFMQIGKRLVLIDCGSSTFSKIKELNLLEDVDVVFVIMTHTHADHVGSLADLVLYNFFVKHVTTQIIIPPGVPVKEILHNNGVDEAMYHPIDIEEDVAVHILAPGERLTLEAVRTEHCEELMTYGYFLTYGGVTIYYSSDSTSIPDKILEFLEEGRISRIYQDMSSAHYEGRVHLSIQDACEAFPLHLRSRVWAMHLDPNFDSDFVKSLGFNVVENYKGDKNNG